MKKIFLFITIIALIIPTIVFAEDEEINQIIDNMTTEEKVAQMIMPSFRWSDEEKTKLKEITPEVEELLNDYNFAGVILFGQNIDNVEQTTRLIDALQKANAENPEAVSQLLIAIDQEGGYVTRLAQGTVMPGNMGLAATDDPELAYEAASVIGSELDAIGVNTNFAPVVDVNSNPENPVIGVRSFSDDPDMVAEYGTEFMEGLQDQGIITALKHFPGHGDTSTDTHTDMTVVDKSKEELTENELKPFQELINNETDMIMTAHIQYPQIEEETYISKQSNEEITLPATLSKTIITDVLRDEMGFDGVIVTDALDMGAVANHFDRLDAATLAINAGVDILLMPVETNGLDAINDFRNYISDVTLLVNDNIISIDNVNASIRRILTLKKKNNLLAPYNVDIEEKVAHALDVVSTVENHEKEFEIAKKVITLVKNDYDVLPLNPEDKTLFLYQYGSHKNSAQYTLDKLTNEGVITNQDNFMFFNFDTELDQIKEEIPSATNVVIIHAMYDFTEESAFDSQSSLNIDEIIDYSCGYGTRVVLVSTQLPYDIARFNSANSIVATYLANGLSFDLLNYDTSKPIPKYGPNLIAGIHSLFDDINNITGKLPVDIYDLNPDYIISNELLYARGTNHLNPYVKEDEVEDEDTTNYSNNPKTNDNIILYMIILIISLGGIIAIKKYN